jgi:hypothetical protein
MDFKIELKNWLIFFKQLLILIAILFVLALSWIGLSVFVAPFYSVTKSGEIQGFQTYNLEGETTTRAIQTGLKDLLNDGLITNFVGVRNIIDNKLNEQIGEIDMFRVSLLSLENNLGRNRGTGGANEHLVQARSNIYADYSVPLFTSYTTLLTRTTTDLDKYLKRLELDKEVPMENKKAVFIVNSDNLAETLDKMKQQLQTTLAKKVENFTQVDDKFYQIRGNLLAMELIFKGLDKDFKNKMIDKSCYYENFLPIMEDIKKGARDNHLIVLESFGDLSKMEKQGNVISQKLSELIDKLRKG